jgi:hypothetical protein
VVFLAWPNADTVSAPLVGLVTATLAFAGVVFTKLPLLAVLFGVALPGIAGSMFARRGPQ